MHKKDKTMSELNDTNAVKVSRPSRSDIPNTISGRIKYARKLQNRSQDWLAQKAGVNRSTLGRWESDANKTLPDALELGLLCDALSTRIAFVVYGALPINKGVTESIYPDPRTGTPIAKPETFVKFAALSEHHRLTVEMLISRLHDAETNHSS